MKILFVGDLSASGFGTVTMDLGRALLALGVDLRFLSQNELGTLPEPFASRTFVLDDKVGWQEAASRGELSIAGILDGSLWADGWRADACVILGDFYAARGVVFLTEASEDAFRGTPTYHYCPVEGVGLPPSWRRLWEIVHPVAMSAFGAREIARITGTLPPVVYHGVSEDFWPVSAERPIRLGTEVMRSRDDCKAHFGLPPEADLLLRTDTNVVRKQWPSLLRALEPVLETHPRAVLLMHTRSADEGGDLRDVWSHISPKARGRMHNPGWKDAGYTLPRAELNALYNAADLYVSTSAEGFGLTIAEALACGVPAVGLDYSAVPEVIGPAGRVVRPEYLFDSPYAHPWAKVDERQFGRTVSALLDDPRERRLLGAKGPAHVRANFDWPRSARQMSDIVAPVLEAVA